MGSSVLCSVSFCSSSYIPTRNFESTLKFPISSRFSQMGMCQFSPWNGLRHMGISISAKPPKDGSRTKFRGKVVYASLFGVGAPEALVIGVVALLVFGPKGLAEVAKNLGKTLRAFQPTIKELQDVSREFKSTLEREIGLDEDPRPMGDPFERNSKYTTPSTSNSSMEDPQNAPVADPNGTPSSKAYSSDEYLKITEEQLKAAAAAQQGLTSSSPESPIELENQPQSPQDVASSPSESSIVAETHQAAQTDAKSTSSESRVEPESQPEAAIQEITTSAPSVQKSETEP